MDTDEIWGNIDRERADLAEFLASLGPEQWATPSLCSAWTVRDVAVHLTHSAAGWPWLTLQLLRSGFRFDATMLRVVREDGRRPDQIVADLRSMVGGRRRPPATAVTDPLLDVLVHGQDIAIPLGVARSMPTAAAVAAAERLWTMGFPFHARKRFAGIELKATDAELSLGQGEPVAGPIKDIVLVLAGRSAGLAGLSGPAAAAGFGPE